MSATQEQIDMLLDFLQEHQGFIKSQIKNSDGRRVHKNQLWAKITAKLNKAGGAVKTVRQGQKVWADRKYLAKRAVAAHRHSGISNQSTSISHGYREKSDKNNSPFLMIKTQTIVPVTYQCSTKIWLFLGKVHLWQNANQKWVQTHQQIEEVDGYYHNRIGVTPTWRCN